MDLRLLQDHLTEAECHLALSEGHIARQIEVIKHLELSGYSTTLALEVLATLRDVHDTYAAHCNLIRKELADMAK
jgi:hypothetical protein